jgi:hypothetical protein
MKEIVQAHHLSMPRQLSTKAGKPECSLSYQNCLLETLLILINQSTRLKLEVLPMFRIMLVAVVFQTASAESLWGNNAVALI